MMKPVKRTLSFLMCILLALGMLPYTTASASWGGQTIDVSWYEPGRSEYYISTPAQLMGLAAIVNGIYNTDITAVTGDDAGTKIVDHYNTDGIETGSNNKSTAAYHYGNDDFNGKTVYLTADLDMSGRNFMPIGGQYLMTLNDSSTKISSSFCGVLDGQGHIIYNIGCNRHCSNGNYGDGASVGLIGRLGVHDNDPVALRPTGAGIRNLAVSGSFYANRSVGGIVGKIGKTNGGAFIENCANYADVMNTDAKGCGGIAGASWNGGYIRNCYNAGDISTTYVCPTGGICGSNEITLENCYNIGQIFAVKESYAMSIGTNNGGASYSSSVINCWYLEDTAAGGGYYNGSQPVNDGEMTAGEMRSPSFLSPLGSAYKEDTYNINGGYPILQWQASMGSTYSYTEAYDRAGGPAAAAVTGVELNKTSLNLNVGDSEALTVTVTPSNAVYSGIDWSSTDPAVAYVDSNGNVIGLKAGTAAIIAAVEGKTAACYVTVTAPSASTAVTGISLSKSTMSLRVNGAEVLTATVTPSNAANAEITWATSDASVAVVSDGLVTAVGSGTAVVTAVAGSYSADCTVQVAAQSQAVTSIILNKTALNLTTGNSETLTATVVPADAEYALMDWRSDNTSVATVANGVVTAVSAGTAVITATAENQTAVCTVNVTDQAVAVTEVILDRTAISLTAGNVDILTATVLPVNATNAGVAWSSSDTSVAAVDNGRITALKLGSAVITATAGGKSATCKVTVTEQVLPVTGIRLNKIALMLPTGGSETLTAAVSPENATNAAVTWVSSDNSVASVVNGTVLALKAGTATVTAAAGGKAASCTVIVSAPAVPAVPTSSPVSADWEDLPVPDFTDVADGAWYLENVDFVMRKGLFDATGETTFSPEAPMTRAMLAQALYRFAGAPEPKKRPPFDDVAANADYADAVAWCYETGVVNGMSADKFAPDRTITREQIVTMFYRFASTAARLDMTAYDGLSGFTDRGDISAWALKSMEWAVGAGLINGMTATTIVPQGTATRAQCAALVQRLARYIAG